jgi:hypothetical protein
METPCMEGSTSVAAVSRDEVSGEGVCEENLHGRQHQLLCRLFSKCVRKLFRMRFL